MIYYGTLPKGGASPHPAMFNCARPIKNLQNYDTEIAQTVILPLQLRRKLGIIDIMR